ncbi:arylsulfatase [Leptospira noumeaensis]|uniref:Arylsulfatase n=2 Tax=Leptospira noumeaensis TaxID=2484964 RepID=A0A4R9I8R8_9LEPT|nr:arylsulfatase [Leptospira noumeaensis]
MFRTLLLRNFSNIILYVLLYVFLGTSYFSVSSWLYFHGFLITIYSILILVLDSYFYQKYRLNQSYREIFIRSVLWTFFVMVLSYVQVYQTALDVSLVVYFFQNFSNLYSDIPNFLYQWKLWQWLSLTFGYYLVFTKSVLDPKKDWIKLTVCILVFVFFRCGLDLSNQITNQNSNLPISNHRFKTNLESIVGKPNLFFVLLEGVPRKHLSKLKSRYIDYSQLNGSHFWVPMPHTSKSLFTWMTGVSQLTNSRMSINESFINSNLPKELELKHGYHTEMIYTQSLYFEGMEQFFPKIFNVVLDKSELQRRYGVNHSSFSWGMNDRVVNAAIKQISETKRNPIFLFLGLSQTHSPYFVSKTNSKGKWNSPYERYMESLSEEVEVLDSLISYLKENFSRETILILSADHGESFGEEGAHAHNYSLYNQETDVPFLIYFVKSGQVYIPKLGSSIHFKDTILNLLETGPRVMDKTVNTNFLKPNYQIDLVLKTWNSEIQKSWIANQKKYIYHSDKDLLLEMDYAEEKRTPIFDSKLKQKVLDHIYSEIR